MHYRTFGTTDLKVSLLCLGTMTFGEQTPPDDAYAQMDLALDSGINFFDTAELYAIPPKAETYGATERIIGEWMQSRKARDKVIIASKVAGPASAMRWIRGGAQLTRAHILAACDDSLKRLQTDYIDLYQIHWPARPVNSFGRMDFDSTQVTGRERQEIDTILDVMTELATAGKIRHLGLSNETPWGVMAHLLSHAENNKRPRVQSIQNPYNLLNRTFEIGLSEVAMQERVGLLAYSPLGGGTLTGKYLNGAMPAGSRRAGDARTSRYKRPLEDLTVQSYVDIAKQAGLDPAVMANAFVNAQPFLTSNIIGATSIDQLRVVLQSAEVSLSPDTLRALNAVHDRHPNPCP